MLSGIIASSYNRLRIVQENLVLNLDASDPNSYGGTGTVWNDISGNNNGTLINNPIYSNDNEGIIEFDGYNQYGYNSDFNIGTDPVFTVSMWIKRTRDFVGGGYWGIGGGSLNNGISCYTNSSNMIGWDLWGKTTFDTRQEYPLNEWVYVNWVKTSTGFTMSNLKTYINGVEYPLTYTMRNSSTTVNLVSGYGVGRLTRNTSGYYAPGYISSFRIYNRVLTDEEILQNYNATKSKFNL